MEFYFVGNGPSAITLSYLLSGHVPYYRGNSNDEFLHLRLSENSDQPLVLQDLEFLSDVSIFLTVTYRYLYDFISPNTPSIAEMIRVKNVMAFVVCGFFNEIIKKEIS